MAPRPIRPLIDRILGGRLTEILVDYRRGGLSFESIAVNLRLEHDIEITGEQVRQWCKELDIDTLAAEPDQAAS